MQILEPNCQTAYSRPIESKRGYRRVLEDNYEGFLDAQPNPSLWCRVNLSLSLCLKLQYRSLSVLIDYRTPMPFRSIIMYYLVYGPTIRMSEQPSAFERYADTKPEIHLTCSRLRCLCALLMNGDILLTGHKGYLEEVQ